MVKVSIVIPVFNVSSYIDKCISSALSQTLSDIQIICINDCSRDDSYEKLLRWAKKDKRIKLVENDKNMGLAATRNIGINHSNGEYIFFLDGDDYIENNTLEKMYFEAKKEDLEMLGAGYIEENNITNVTTIHSFVDKTFIVSGEECLHHFSKSKDYPGMSCLYLYKRSFLLDNSIKFIEGIVHEDSAFFFDCTVMVKRIGFIKEELYHYVRRPNSITINSSNIIDKVESLCVIVKHVMDRLEDEPRVSLRDEIRAYLKCMTYVLHSRYKDIDFFPDDYRYKYVQTEQVLPLVQASFYKGYFPYKFLKSQMEIIRNSHRVLIYGNGKVGKAVEELLVERGISNYTFVVTQSKNSNEVLISDWIPLKEKVAVIISSTKYCDELYKNAIDLGFNNVIIPKF